MTAIAVRAVAPGDGEILLRMTRELARVHDVLDLHQAAASNYEDALFCAQPIIGAFLAFDGADAAGAAVWHRSYSTNRGCEIMYLEDVVVLPPHRRKGVAHALLRAVSREAVKRAYPSVYWLMAEWNAEAGALYDKIGAVAEPGNIVWRLSGTALHGFAR